MRVGTAVGIDIVMVLAFAVVGRASHSESDAAVGVLTTAWPYLVATVIGTGLALLPRGGARHDPYGRISAVVVWLTTVILGMGLRLLSGATAAWPFWIVAFITLGLLLMGWRLVARSVLRARSRPAR